MNENQNLFGKIAGWQIVLITIIFVFGNGFIVGTILSFDHHAYGAITLFCADILFMFFLYKWFLREKISFKKLFGSIEFRMKDFFKIFGLVILIEIFGISLDTIIAYFFPQFVQNMDSVLTYFGAGWWLVFIGISIVILAPIYEEVLIRGILMQYWAKKWNPSVGIILTSIFFTALHGEPKIFPQIFLLALIFSIMYFKTNKLGASIIAHVINNSIAFFGFLIIVRFYGFEYFQSSQATAIDKNAFIGSLFWLVFSGIL